MRKIIVFMATTLDGYFAGSDGEIDWHVVDEEFNQFAIDQLNAADMLLFGRVTYEGMASYWQTPSAAADSPVIAEKMNTLPKIVFSRTLSNPDWQSTSLVKDHIPEMMAELKQQPGKDMLIFGSSNLAATFINLGLIDEFRLMVNPVVLGRGKPLFGGIEQPLKLKLLKTRSFNSGSVLHYYQPA